MPLRRLQAPLTLSLSLALVLVGCSGSDGAAGAAGAAGTPGADGQAGAPGKNALVRLETEPPGANCPSGGTKVLAGVDTNSDGTLQPSEVTGTPTYVCSGPQAAACTSLEGTVTITNSLDWRMLAESGCTGITGDLVINAPGVVHLTGASPLRTIGGSLVVRDQSSLVELSLPALTRVDRDILVAGTGLTTLSFPALTTVTGQVAVGAYPLLAIGLNASLTSIDLPALTTAGSIDVGDSVNDQGVLASLNLPVLTSLTGDLLVHDAPLLTAASFPKLTLVGGVASLARLAALTTISLPLLNSTSELDASYCTSLTSLSMPALTLIDADLKVTGDTVLGSASFPLLGTVGGQLLVTTNDAFTSLTAPVLTSVGSDLVLGPSLVGVTVALPQLATVGGNLSVFDLNLPTFSLPLVTAVGGSVAFTANPGLVSLSLPLLAHINGALDITGNPVLASFALPVLATLGLGPPTADLTVTNNPALPQCSVDALVTRLGAGLAGAAISSGNDAAGLCP
jgi:hypothetical protein